MKRVALIKAFCKSALLKNEQLLVKLTDAHYSIKVKSFYGSSIGSHMRHVLDHFEVALNAKQSTILKYDERRRNTDIETDRRAAIEKNKQMLSLLDSAELPIDDASAPMTVAFMQDPITATNFQCSSNFARELAFVSHHATHHHALIMLMMHHHGYNDSSLEGVGMAVSTQHADAEQAK